MKEELERIEPGSFKKYCEFISQNKYKYDVSLDLVMGTNSNNICEFVGAAAKHPEALFKMNIIEKHYSYISKFFKTDKLRQAFSFQNMYMGISPYDATAAYSILQYIECAMGIWYPEGGMWQIINTLIKNSEENGAVYHYNKSVADIDIDNGVAKGVILETGEKVQGDIVLCNADLTYAYKSLVHDTEYVKKLDTMAYTSSTISFYWGIKKKVNGLQGHNIFLAEEYKESFVQIFKDLEIPDVPSFYLHVPSKIDPTCAPNGCEVITVLVPIGHLKNDDDNIDYTDLILKTKKAILSKLKSSGVDDFEKDIEFEDVNTPNTWKSKFNLYKGAALGLNHQLTQMFFLRPHNKSKYKNLYFVGASTHPGTGVPVVVSSARLVCEVIDNDYGA
jgi:phytoene desaturase (3,4-didehydrolycopene-forming)